MIQPNPAPQSDGPYQHGASLIPIQKNPSAQYHLNVGKSLYHSYLARSRQQDLDAAIQHFQKAVEMEPTLAEAYVQLASALWDQGTINLELAQFYCETALRIDPNQSDANLFLGYFLQRGGFLDDAVQQYQTAIGKNFWRSSRPRIALGNTLLKQSLETKNRLQQLALVGQGVTQFLVGCTLLPADKTTCLLLKEALIADLQIYTLDFMAKGFKQVGLPHVARHLYTMGVKTMPKEPLFYHLLGDDALYDQNDPKAAAAWFKKAQALDPTNLTLLKKLGKAYTNAHDIPNAIQTLNVVVEKDANDFDTLYNLGQIHTEEKAYFKALYYFKEAEKRRPNYPYVHSNMAYVMFKLDDVEGAFEEYKNAMEYGTDPIWLSTVAQTLGTISYQVHQNLHEALEYMQQALHYNPENVDALVMLADLYFEAGQMETAISAYKTILQIDPQNSDCFSNIGYILWQMDRNQEAIDAYMAAIYYDRKNHIAHNNLGVIYLDEQSSPEKALPLFQTALDLKPDYTLACFNIGRAMAALGQTMEAAEKFSESLSLNQLNPELENTEIQEYISRLFE